MCVCVCACLSPPGLLSSASSRLALTSSTQTMPSQALALYMSVLPILSMIIKTYDDNIFILNHHVILSVLTKSCFSERILISKQPMS